MLGRPDCASSAQHPGVYGLSVFSALLHLLLIMHFYLGLYGDSGNEMFGIKESEPGHTGVCLVLCVSDNHHGPTPRCLSKGSDFFLYVF